MLAVSIIVFWHGKHSHNGGVEPLLCRVIVVFHPVYLFLDARCKRCNCLALTLNTVSKEEYEGMHRFMQS
jgi:hypothetical protein